MKCFINKNKQGKKSEQHFNVLKTSLWNSNDLPKRKVAL